MGGTKEGSKKKGGGELDGRDIFGLVRDSMKDKRHKGGREKAGERDKKNHSLISMTNRST